MTITSRTRIWYYIVKEWLTREFVVLSPITLSEKKQKKDVILKTLKKAWANIFSKNVKSFGQIT